MNHSCSPVLLNETVHYIEDGPKDGLRRRATDHEAVHIRQFYHLVSIGFRHGTTVDDADNVGLC